MLFIAGIGILLLLIWAGLLPVKKGYEVAVPDPLLKEGIGMGASVVDWK